MLSKSRHESSLNFSPRAKELNRLYQWLFSIPDRELDAVFDELIDKLNTIFGANSIEQYKIKINFNRYDLKSFDYTNEKRAYVDDFIEFVISQEIWEEYHREYEFFTNKTQRQSNLKHLLVESRIQDIFTEVGISFFSDVDKSLNKLTESCLGVYSIFDFLQTYLGTNTLTDGFALGITSNLKSSYDIFTKILGLQRWEAVYGKQWFYDSCYDHKDIEAGYRKFRIYGSSHHTNRFFNFVISTNKPIVFFIPADIGDPNNHDSVTYGEIAWLGQALQADPNKLKNVILVFDAYNYLPLYILNQKRDEVQLTVDVNTSIEAIKAFLLEYVVDDNRQEPFKKYTFENIYNHKTRNLIDGIYSELILSAEYNSCDSDNNSNELLELLQHSKIVIGDYFSNTITLQELFNYFRDIIRYDDLQGIRFKLTMVTIDFIKRIFADAEYQELFSHEVDYQIEVSKILEKIAGAFDLKLTNLLNTSNNLQEIIEYYSALLEAHPTLQKIVHLEKLSLFLTSLPDEDRKDMQSKLGTNLLKALLMTTEASEKKPASNSKEEIQRITDKETLKINNEQQCIIPNFDQFLIANMNKDGNAKGEEASDSFKLDSYNSETDEENFTSSDEEECNFLP